MDKVSTQEEDIIIVNIYAPNTQIPTTNTNRHKRRN